MSTIKDDLWYYVELYMGLLLVGSQYIVLVFRQGILMLLYVCVYGFGIRIIKGVIPLSFEVTC